MNNKYIFQIKNIYFYIYHHGRCSYLFKLHTEPGFRKKHSNENDLDLMGPGLSNVNHVHLESPGLSKVEEPKTVVLAFDNQK